MADTASSSTTSRRRIPVIVFERPALDWGRVILGLLLGLLVGAVLGIGQWWLAGVGGDSVGAEWLFAPRTRYLWPLAFVGIVAGLVIAWGWKREQQARIELVEMAPTPREARRRRRAAASTELDRPSWS